MHACMSDRTLLTHMVECLRSGIDWPVIEVLGIWLGSVWGRCTKAALT